MALLAGPIVLTNLGQMALQVTDVVMIGRLGGDALAAGALGSSTIFTPFILGIGLMLATAPIMAQERGRRPHAVREVRRTVRQGFWMAASFAVPMWLLLWHTDAILRLFGQPAHLIGPATSYVYAAMWGFLPALWYVVLRNFVAALERPRAALYAMIVGVLINAVADYMLIFGKFGAPALGVTGAGVATTLTNILLASSLLAYTYADRSFRRFHLMGRFWRSDWPRYVEIFRVGLPIGVALLLEVTLFTASTFLMGSFGAAAIAGHQIAVIVASVTFMVPMGLSQAATVRVGLAVGRGDRRGVLLAGLVALTLGTGFMAVMSVLILIAPRPLVALFIDMADPANAAVVRLGVGFLTIAALFQIFDGAQAIGSGALRGLKDTRAPMVYCAISYWLVGMGSCLWLAFGAGLNGNGIWIGLLLGLLCAAVLMVRRFLRLARAAPRPLARPHAAPEPVAPGASGPPGVPSPVAASAPGDMGRADGGS